MTVKLQGLYDYVKRSSVFMWMGAAYTKQEKAGPAMSRDRKSLPTSQTSCMAENLWLRREAAFRRYQWSAHIPFHPNRSLDEWTCKNGSKRSLNKIFLFNKLPNHKEFFLHPGIWSAAFWASATVSKTAGQTEKERHAVHGAIFSVCE